MSQLVIRLDVKFTQAPTVTVRIDNPAPAEEQPVEVETSPQEEPEPQT